MHLFFGRQGQMEFNQIYFYTATIVEWKNLLFKDEMKMVIVQSLQTLKERGMLRIYGYVIMPNHIHLLCEMAKRNGKESPVNSFMKFTAHRFKKILQQTNPAALESFKAQRNDRMYAFWKRDPLAISITSDEAFFQKLEYIHNNPVAEKWRLCKQPEDYRWSSAAFYLSDADPFKIVTHFN